jgi:hypothetical protein
MNFFDKVDVTVIPGPNSDPERLRFSWETVNITSNEFILQLTWEEDNLKYVSTQGGYDTL